MPPTRTTRSKEAPAAPTPIVGENPAAYDEGRLWRNAPWGDTEWCEMCSTCLRWRASQRLGGRVCVTAFNFSFPLVIVERGRCNEYRPIPGAENLWTEAPDEEEDDAYSGERRREGEADRDEEGGDARRRTGARRRPRRRARRGGGGGAGAPGGAPPAPSAGL